MSETAQLLNLLVGLPAALSTAHAAQAGGAVPGAAASEGFLALLALAQADLGASLAPGSPASAASPQSSEAEAAKAKELLNFATPETQEETEARAQARHTPAELSLLLPPDGVDTRPSDWLVPEAARPAKDAGLEEMEASAPPDLPIAGGDLAILAEPPPSVPPPPASLSQESLPLSREADALPNMPSLTANGDQPSALPPAAGQAQSGAADAAANATAEVLAAASELSKPVPTREAIVNASLTAVTSTLLGNMSETSRPGATTGSADKSQPKPSGMPQTASVAPKEPSPRNGAAQLTAEPTSQSSAPRASDELALRGEPVRPAPAADPLPSQQFALRGESAIHSHASAEGPSQGAHAAVPVIVIRTAHGAHTSALPQDRIALAIVRQLNAGISRFEIRLDPPELGRIDVKMSLRADGHVSAQLTADRPDTLDLLQRDARALQRALTEAGLHMDSGSLSFGLRDRGGHPAFEDNEPSQSLGSADEDDESAAAPHYGVALTASLEPGRVDIRI